MTTYTCPTCGEEMTRDLLVFTRHTEEHIAEEMTKPNERYGFFDKWAVKLLPFNLHWSKMA